MRPVPRPIWAALGATLLMGCGGERGAARYGWLRLKGEPSSAPSTATIILEDQPPEAEPIAWVEPVEEPLKPAPVTWTAPDEREASYTQTLSVDRTEPEPIVLAQDTDYFQDRPHPWNKVAVASLPITVIGVVVAIIFESTLVLGIAGAVGLALALIGGRHAREHEERGRGFAMPAMIIGAVALFLATLAVISGL